MQLLQLLPSSGTLTLQDSETLAYESEHLDFPLTVT